MANNAPYNLAWPQVPAAILQKNAFLIWWFDFFCKILQKFVNPWNIKIFEIVILSKCVLDVYAGKIFKTGRCKTLYAKLDIFFVLVWCRGRGVNVWLSVVVCGCLHFEVLYYFSPMMSVTSVGKFMCFYHSGLWPKSLIFFTSHAEGGPVPVCAHFRKPHQAAGANTLQQHIPSLPRGGSCSFSCFILIHQVEKRTKWKKISSSAPNLNPTQSGCPLFSQHSRQTDVLTKQTSPRCVCLVLGKGVGGIGLGWGHL